MRLGHEIGLSSSDLVIVDYRETNEIARTMHLLSKTTLEQITRLHSHPRGVDKEFDKEYSSRVSGKVSPL